MIHQLLPNRIVTKTFFENIERLTAIIKRKKVKQVIPESGADVELPQGGQEEMDALS